MAKCSNKHPSWFKLKTERRQLIKELPPESAVNVLLACLDFLEVGSFPKAMCPIEKIAASAFLPDLEEAWARYEQRVNARASSKNTGRKNRMVSCDIERYHATSCETEEETEPDPLKGDGSKTVDIRNTRGAASKGGPPPVQLFDPYKPETWGDAE